MSKADLLLVGAGPVGWLMASALLQNGQAFDWYIRNPEVRALASKLNIQFPEKDLQTATDTVIFPAKQPTTAYNTVITCVKSQQTENLMASLPLNSTTRRLAVANGLINGDYHLGLLYGGAFLQEGVLHTSHSNTLRIGSLGSILDDSQYFADLLACEWLDTKTDADVELRQWHKLALNCIVNPLTAMHDVKNGSLLELLDSPLVDGLLAEICNVAKRQLGTKWTFRPDQIKPDVIELINDTVENSSSMREDLRHGRQPEISHMNAAIARLGREFDVPCPLNQAVAEIIVRIAELHGSTR